MAYVDPSDLATRPPLFRKVFERIGDRKGMGIEPTVVGTKLLGDIAVKGASSVYDRAQKWFRSFDLLILGQERAGKTALYKFFRSRLLSRDGERTLPTVDNINSGIFSFEWTTGTSKLLLEFRNVGDRSGQIGPNEHAKMFVSKKPHLLIIVLDITSLDVSDRLHSSYEAWITYFCTYVGDLLMNNPRRARRLNSRLRNLVILLNKVDVLEPDLVADAVGLATARIRGVLQDRLRPYFGGKVDIFPILPCSIVENPRHGTTDETARRLEEVVRQLVASTITR